MIINFDTKFTSNIIEQENENSEYTVNVNPEVIKGKDFVNLASTCIFDLSRSVKAVTETVSQTSSQLQTLMTGIQNLTTQVKQNTTDIQKHTEYINNLKEKSQAQDIKIQNLEEKLATEVKKCNEACLSLERYSRNFNIRIQNIPEDKDESPEISVQKAKEVIKNVTKLDIEVEYGHRLGKSNNNKPRTIIIKLFSRFQIRKVMAKRKEMYLNGFPVFMDLPQADHETKMKHAKVMQEKFKEGHKVKFFNGSWYINGAVYKED